MQWKLGEYQIRTCFLRPIPLSPSEDKLSAKLLRTRCGISSVLNNSRVSSGQTSSGEDARFTNPEIQYKVDEDQHHISGHNINIRKYMDNLCFLFSSGDRVGSLRCIEETASQENEVRGSDEGSGVQ
jgi:hypothetical protein